MTEKSLKVNIVIFKKPALVLCCFFISLLVFFSLAVNAYSETQAWKTVTKITEDNKITVHWQDKGADIYRVMRGTSKDGAFTEIGTTNELKFTDNLVKKNKPYYYIVKAYEVKDKKALLIDTSRMCKEALNTLKQVDITLADPTYDGNVISWDKVSYAYDYAVYRSSSPKETQKLIGTTRELSYKDDSVNKNDVHYYSVRARLKDSDYKGKLSSLVKVESNAIDNYWAYFLVNADNILPASYKVNLETVQGRYALDKRCAKYARQMLSDGISEGLSLQVVSAYRSPERQRLTMVNQINYYVNKGHSWDNAKNLAAREVQIPGASEHNAGLAIDIVTANWYLTHDDLTSDFAHTKEYEWLSKNAHKYGFILRYQKDKEHITGIYYEPWHYRFVGLEMAEKIYDSGLSLEEFVTLTKIEEKLESTFKKNADSSPKLLSKNGEPINAKSITPLSLLTGQLGDKSPIFKQSKGSREEHKTPVSTDALYLSENQNETAHNIAIKPLFTITDNFLPLTETCTDDFLSTGNPYQGKDENPSNLNMDLPPTIEIFIDEYDLEKGFSLTENLAFTKKSLSMPPANTFIRMPFVTRFNPLFDFNKSKNTLFHRRLDVSC